VTLLSPREKTELKRQLELQPLGAWTHLTLLRAPYTSTNIPTFISWHLSTSVLYSPTLSSETAEHCLLLSDSNSRYHSTPFPTHQVEGSLPETDWQLDFTHMPTVRCAKYLLVLVDTFSRWVEAFLTHNKRIQTVSDLLPWIGVPASLQSNNGPEFTLQISQILLKALDILWYFYIPYHPQSLGKSENANHSLKTTLAKLLQELHLDWLKLLPLACFMLYVLPKWPLLIPPFELMYRYPVLTIGLLPKFSPLPDHLHTPLLCHLRSLIWNFADHIYVCHTMFPVHCLSMLETKSFYLLQIITPHPCHPNGKVFLR
jgi:transposase InsO family protein